MQRATRAKKIARGMTPKQGLTFVKRHGIVLQAARGPVPSLAEAIVGGPIGGSWWAHPKGSEIYRVADAISESDDVLVCKLVDGKVTYVHRRLWPALVKLAPRFSRDRLAKIWDEHTERGTHRSKSLPFPQWVPKDVLTDADALSEEAAEALLGSLATQRRSALGTGATQRGESSVADTVPRTRRSRTSESRRSRR